MESKVELVQAAIRREMLTVANEYRDHMSVQDIMAEAETWSWIPVFRIMRRTGLTRARLCKVLDHMLNAEPPHIEARGLAPNTADGRVRLLGYQQVFESSVFRPR